MSYSEPPKRLATSLGGGDPFDALLALMGNDRIDEAASARTRQRWLRTQAGEEATFTGVLLDLAERNRAVSLRLHDGRRRRAVLHGIGSDFVAIESAEQQRSLLRITAIVAASSADDGDLPSGDRTVASNTDLITALAGLAADRPDVVLRSLHAEAMHGDALAGELQSVGFDVARLRVHASRQTLAVNLETVAEVVVL